MRIARLLLFVGFAVVLALTIFLLFSQGSLENRLDCDRGTGVCTFRERLLTRVSSSWEHLASMGPAEIRTSPPGRRAPVITVWVKSREGDSYFDAYATWSAAQKDVDEINGFLGSPSTPHLSLVREHKVLYWTAWSLSLVSVTSLGALAYVLFFRRAKTTPERGEPQVER